MNTRKLINNGYIVFDDSMQAYLPSHRGWNKAFEDNSGVTPDMLSDACLRLNNDRKLRMERLYENQD